MQVIRPILALNQKSPDVANLHAALDRLQFGRPITEPERTEKLYGQGTFEAVRELQLQFGIVTRQFGIVEEQTAESINRRLFEMGVFRLVEGRVTNRDGSPVVGNLLFALDKDNISGTPLGQTNTNEDGHYQTYYDPLLYSRPGEGVRRVKEVIDLIVQVYDANGATLAESQPLHNSRQWVQIDLEVGDPVALPGFIVRGQVVDASGPLNDIEVTVFDRDLFFRRRGGASGQQLGHELTKHLSSKNTDGWFEISFATSAFAKGDVSPANGEPVPDLVFAISQDGQSLEKFEIVRLPDGKELMEETIVSNDDRILGIQARRVEEIRIVLEGGEPKQEMSEYDRVWRAIEPLLPDRPDENADEPVREKLVCEAANRFDEETHRDVSFVARETRLDWVLIRAFAAASKLWVDPFKQDLPASVFYGLARMRAAFDLFALARLSTDDMHSGLEEAAAGTQPIIPPFDPVDRLKAAVQKIRDTLAHHVPTYRPTEGAPSLEDLIGADLPDREDQATLMRIYSEYSDTPGKIWTALKEQPGFEDGTKIAKLQYSFQLGLLAQNNIALVNAIRAKHPTIVHTTELAFELDTQEKWTALLDEAAISIPDDVPGKPEERKANYAASLAVAMQVAHPTVAVANMVASLPATHLANTQPAVAKFLTDAVRTANFDLVAGHIDDLVTEHGESLLKNIEEKNRPAVIDQVKRLQRLFRLSTGPESMKALVEAGFTSARELAELPSEVAMDMLKPVLGEATAQVVLNRANNIAAAAVHQYVFLNGAANGDTLHGGFL
jgi:hypothetical protein